MRCLKLVSVDVTYRRCMLDASHTIPCVGEADWMQRKHDKNNTTPALWNTPPAVNKLDLLDVDD